MELYVTQIVKCIPDDYTNMQPYVFSAANKHPVPLDDVDEILAPPFALCSIEVEKGLLSSGGHGSLGVNLRCLVAREITFNEYVFNCSMEVNGGVSFLKVSSDKIEIWNNQKLVTTLDGEQVDIMYDFLKNIFYQFIARFHASRIGLFNTTDKAKYKDSTGRNCTFKGLQISYISEKKPSGEHALPKRSNIKWIQTTKVIKHWRRISPESLGVDRKGERCVPGWTFIDEYTKGEGRALIKTRRIK